MSGNTTLFPVYVYEENMPLPKEGTYFLVAGNGNWMHKDTGIVSGFIRVEQISVLPDYVTQNMLNCNLPKIPARLAWRIKQFFQRVVSKYRAEAEVTLYYNKEKKDFKIHVPNQFVSHSSVNYQRVGMSHLDESKDYLCVGTIHSHADFDAFHSTIDDKDEVYFDGLHITFGHNDKDDFSISASIVINGIRQKIDPLEVMEGIRQVGGVHNRYSLIDLDYDPEFHEWADGIDDWLECVKPASWPTQNFDVFKSRPFVNGDKVTWVSDTNPLNTVIGSGPFVVENDHDGKIIIETRLGKSRFSEKLFKKVQHG